MTIPAQWPRWSNYVQQGGWTYPEGDRAAPYLFTGADDLPALLARMGGPEPLDEQLNRLLAFNETFGLLGCSQDRLDRQKFDGRGEVRTGEPSDWAIHHAQNVRLIMLLQERRGRDLIDLFAELRSRDSPLAIPITRWPWSIPKDVRMLLGSGSAATVDQATSAGPLLAALLNPNLGAVTKIFDPATSQPRFYFRSLLDLLYWQLSESLVGNVIRRCRCGALFFAMDPRQRYCPPLRRPGESLCAKKFRMRKSRQRRREAG